MINRPSTPRVLADVVAELEKEVLPLLTDPVSQTRLQMIMSVLGQCALRAGNEIAWMTEESALYAAFAREVAASQPNPSLETAIDAIAQPADLRLATVSTQYSRAGEALALALETALDRGLDELVARGEQLLVMRIANEMTVTGAPVFAGR